MSPIRALLRSTPLSKIMIKPVMTVHENDEFHIVQEKMAAHDIRHLPVVNDAGVLVGIITERYLYKIHSPRKLEDGSWYYDKQALDGFILKNVMIQDPFTLTPQNTLEEAVQAMSQFKFGCTIIVDEYRVPCGIVTRKDILKFLLTK